MVRREPPRHRGLRKACGLESVETPDGRLSGNALRVDVDLQGAGVPLVADARANVFIVRVIDGVDPFRAPGGLDGRWSALGPEKPILPPPTLHAVASRPTHADVM